MSSIHSRNHQVAAEEDNHSVEGGRWVGSTSGDSSGSSASVNRISVRETQTSFESPSVSHILAYDDPVVSVKDVLNGVFDRPLEKTKNYVFSLFQITHWIYRYNFVWLYSDLIAGLTVGAVLVPQSMSYAQIAGLPPQYGLYSSFVGVIIYCFFATSKDVSIGPVAVMSLETSKVVTKVTAALPQYADNPAVIATTLALLCGSIALGIGLLRLGFILEYIPLPGIMGFMTGSAFTILVGQVPGLFGVNKLLNTRAAGYLVVIDFLKVIKHSNLNAAFGLVSLFFLYFIRYGTAYLTKRYPRYKTPLFFLNVLRAALVIIFATLISWGVCKSHRHTDKKYPISILKTVPRGLKDVGVHKVDRQVVEKIAPELPIATIVLLLEHIAISKSFGRINDYTINPNQELIAIGVTNLIGQFFAAYPATGSFSRSALKAKCGVRTPLAGIFSGILVLVAIYGLTGAFYWIPNASLCAIIIHAVADLMVDIFTTYRTWNIQPIEFVIFFVAVMLSVFVTLEAGIYFSAASSLVWLLLRVSFPTGQFLGRVHYVEVTNPPPLFSYSSNNANEEDYSKHKNVLKSVQQKFWKESLPIQNAAPGHEHDLEKDPFPPQTFDHDAALSLDEDIFHPKSQSSEEPVPKGKARQGPNTTGWSNIKSKWVPFSKKSLHKDIEVLPPPPGVFVYRFNESFTYPNSSRQLDNILAYVKKHTRRNIDAAIKVRLGDRPWNDHGPRNLVYDPNVVDERPIARAIFFDLSTTPHIDLSGVQALIDLRQALDKYANKKVEYHFVGIISPWSRRALIAGGFGGYDDPVKPSISQLEVVKSPNNDNFLDDEEASVDSTKKDPTRSVQSGTQYYLPIVGTNTPFFHLDIPDLSAYEINE